MYCAGVSPLPKFRSLPLSFTIQFSIGRANSGRIVCPPSLKQLAFPWITKRIQDCKESSQIVLVLRNTMYSLFFSTLKEGFTELAGNVSIKSQAPYKEII